MKDLKKCIDFHGHKCMGLLIGYRAAKYAMKILKERVSKDEELVALVENSSCFVDAVSVITGCTYGKGNLIFKDYGKMAFSLISRKSGKGIRIYYDSNKLKMDNEQIQLMNKIFEGKASRDELKKFEKIKKQRERQFMKLKDKDLFKVYEYNGEIPPKARIYKSIKCDICGELAMETKINNLDGKKVCYACLDK